MSLWCTRGLRPLLAAESVSVLGSQMTFVALPWFVLVTTGSAARMGLVLAVELLPVALLGIPSGTVVAKLGARRTMIVCDAARAPLMLAIPLLHSAGLLSFPLLLACVALIGVFIASHFSAQRLILPDLVGEDERAVTRANAIIEGVQRSTGLLGPAAGAGRAARRVEIQSPCARRIDPRLPNRGWRRSRADNEGERRIPRTTRTGLLQTA